MTSAASGDQLAPQLNELAVAQATARDNLSRLIEVEAFGSCGDPVCCPLLVLEGLKEEFCVVVQPRGFDEAKFGLLLITLTIICLFNPVC